MNSLWWLALPVLLLPVWWHRQKREQTRALPLASARFVPRSEPNQVRVWRWTDIVLLVLRCLLLATVIAWLADPVLPWRGDAVLVVQGTRAAAVEQEVAAAKMKDAQRIELPGAQLLAWLHSHEREWRGDARLLVVGDVPMPATLPQFTHAVTLRTMPAPARPAEHHLAIVSDRADDWRKLFSALDGSQHYVVDATPGAKTELLIWDKPAAPPAALHAPLWWITDPAAFPALQGAKAVDGIRYADSPQGRLWTSDAWPPKDAASARALFETWQRLHYAPVPFTAPAQVLAPGRAWATGEAEGELRALLAMAIVGLFALERILTHARRR
jgi:hypothetical protein